MLLVVCWFCVGVGIVAGVVVVVAAVAVVVAVVVVIVAAVVSCMLLLELLLVGWSVGWLAVVGCCWLFVVTGVVSAVVVGCVLVPVFC